MPLRVLLLLPDGEQPSVSQTSGYKPDVNPPKSPTNHSFKAPPSPSSAVPSRLSNDYRSVTLPTPSIIPFTYYIKRAPYVNIALNIDPSHYHHVH